MKEKISRGEQIKIKGPVKINGVRQNCYALDVFTNITAKFPTGNDHTIEMYDSLEKKELPNGYVVQLEKKDYPINAKSVSSYADGADYRRDPAQAIANAPKRVNLGDVTQVQEFIDSNPQEAVRVMRDVLARLEKVNDKPAAESAAESAAEPAPTGGN